MLLQRASLALSGTRADDQRVWQLSVVSYTYSYMLCCTATVSWQLDRCTDIYVMHVMSVSHWLPHAGTAERTNVIPCTSSEIGVTLRSWTRKIRESVQMPASSWTWGNKMRVTLAMEWWNCYVFSWNTVFIRKRHRPYNMPKIITAPPIRNRFTPISPIFLEPQLELHDQNGSATCLEIKP